MATSDQAILGTFYSGFCHNFGVGREMGCMMHLTYHVDDTCCVRQNVYESGVLRTLWTGMILYFTYDHEVTQSAIYHGREVQLVMQPLYRQCTGFGGMGASACYA